MTASRTPGSSTVARRALIDIIRPAVAGSYGVTGFVPGSVRERVLGWLRLGQPGIHVHLRDGIEIDLHLTVAFGLPVAEVARQADSAVRYALRRATGREVARLTIHVGGMRYASPLPSTEAGPGDGTPAPAADAVIGDLGSDESTPAR